MKKRIFLVFTLLVLTSQIISAQTTAPKEKRPIIFIPGILGSRLVNSDTGENVWVKLTRSKDDDLRLPMSPNLASNHDKLVANQIVERIKILKYFPQISIYQGMTDFFAKAGYKRGDWDNPHLDGAAGDHDTYYLFAYDWRRDNVETVHKLFQQMDKLRLKLGKPDLKFDVVAHSMGGLVARYAAMYGRSDLTDTPKPNWEGAKYFNKIFLFGTPNDGAMLAFDTILNGYSVPTFAGRTHFGVLNKEVALSSPAIFQLIPHGAALRFYDEDLKPMKVDIYDPQTWKTYKWSAAYDPAYLSTLSKSNALQVDKYFLAVLGRAKKFHAALDAQNTPPATLHFFAYGSDCKMTLDGAVIYREKDSTEWKTLIRGDSFRNSKGEKVDDKKVKEIMYSPGDGAVTKRSLIAEILSLPGKITNLLPSMTSPLASPFLTCADHGSLLDNKTMQDTFLQEVLKD
jgi:pimeloyl-ACP methyl ester carboxylesterase